MGSTNEFGRFAHEHQHKVVLTKPFYMGVYEVTQAEYEKVTGKNPSHFAKSGEGKEAVGDLDTARFPVESVTWEEAVEFCRRLSELPAEKEAGRSYRLPTEAEWEYACRAGTTTVFHFGESLASTQANFDGNYPYLEREDVLKGEDPKKLQGPYLKRPTTVGSYEPNAWGLYDMHGNIWEWVADWYSPVYYKSSPEQDPQGPEEGTKKVSRGGGWYYFAAGCRAASRYEREPDERRNTDGFRVVCVQGTAAKAKTQRF
jgi:formylglycine-generating enzyme required for sulfatase activity